MTPETKAALKDFLSWFWSTFLVGTLSQVPFIYLPESPTFG